MRLILQRVGSASVTVDGQTVARIGQGILALVGVEKGDDENSVRKAVDKLASLRIFADESGRMNLAASDIGGEFLVVSQFTLAASLARGRRPSFDRAAPPDLAEPLVESLACGLEGKGLTVGRGRFGAYMQVKLTNDGPVTFVLDT